MMYVKRLVNVYTHCLYTLTSFVYTFIKLNDGRIASYRPR